MTDSHEGFLIERREPAFRRVRGVAGVLSSWRASRSVWNNMALDTAIAPRVAQYAELPRELHPSVTAALSRRGIQKLYSHQVEAFLLSHAGRHTVVATPTASGKSLCYNLPVLDRFARDAQTRALYLFPTKALSRDQETSLRAFMQDVGLPQGAVTYDGDTPGDARRAARERTGVLLTNPDMLHAGILPHHASWARFFANLRYVVIDELHTYAGVFGSHLANVLRRLQRVARFHGSSPSFIFASATIGNPREHASRMLGRDVDLVGESGSPAGARRFLVYNPPVVNAELGIRASYIKSAVRLAADLAIADVPTLVFGQSRNAVEVMLKYLRDRLAREKLDTSAVQGYRGGYLPEMRRAIENGLRAGDIRCVVATNALELGIDIGSLDAVICAGYPGSVAGLWQRFGRGGRRGGESLNVLVTSSAPLDQYLARDPSFLVGAPVEQARIDPDNPEVLVQHMKCSAFELPFEQGETFGDLPADAVEETLDFLAQHRVVHPVRDAQDKATYHWATDAYPANHVSLRSIGWDNFVIIDVERERTIAEMDYRAAHTMLHEQAIYQQDAEQYQVERLDYENHKAFVRKVKPDYYTQAMTYTRVGIIEEEARHELHSGARHAFIAGVGDVSVIEKVVGYKKIKFHTHENVGYGDVRLPEMQMHTTALWLTVPEEVVLAQPFARASVVDALRAFGNALHTVAVMGLMTDPRDLGQTMGSAAEPGGVPGKSQHEGPGFDPTIFLYDHVAGGIGLARRLFEERETLVRKARHLVESCSCGEGCPSCIGPVGTESPGGAVEPASLKRVALTLLSSLGIEAVH